MEPNSVQLNIQPQGMMEPDSVFSPVEFGDSPFPIFPIGPIHGIMPGPIVSPLFTFPFIVLPYGPQAPIPLEPINNEIKPVAETQLVSKPEEAESADLPETPKVLKPLEDEREQMDNKSTALEIKPSSPSEWYVTFPPTNKRCKPKYMYGKNTKGERSITDVSGPVPQNDSEIFIGNLPDDMFEEKFHSLFEHIGPIYQVRVKVNFSGKGRGYGFVHFYHKVDAYRAVRKMNGFKFDPSKLRKMTVQISANNNRLFIEKVPPSLDAQDIFEIAHGVGMTSVVAVDCPLDSQTFYNTNRGYCFLEFATHMDAMMARKSLMRDPTGLFQKTSVIANWARPKIPQF